MKNILVAVLLMVVATVYGQSNFTYPSLVVQYDSAVFFRNLKLIPITQNEWQELDTGWANAPFLSLKNGLKTRLVQVKERGNYMLDNINVVIIENKSGKDLQIKSGEVVVGGRQDRVFAVDTILSGSQTTHTVPVYCIEENRWSKYEKKFNYGGNTNSGLQQLIDSASNQTLIWNEIRKWLKASNQTSSSYAALLNNRNYADTTNAYIRFFLEQLPLKDSNIVGIMAVTGNRVIGADVFASSSLFYQTLANLLEKYCSEGVLHGTAPVISPVREVAYADELFSPATQAEKLRKKGKSIYYKGVLIQITGY